MPCGKRLSCHVCIDYACSESVGLRGDAASSPSASAGSWSHVQPYASMLSICMVAVCCCVDTTGSLLGVTLPCTLLRCKLTRSVPPLSHQ